MQTQLRNECDASPYRAPTLAAWWRDLLTGGFPSPRAENDALVLVYGRAMMAHGLALCLDLVTWFQTE